MLNFLASYLKIFVFAALLLAGLQVPGFVDQYGKNLAARRAEAQLALASYQADASKFFAGDMHKLIAHYRANADTIIQKSGDNLAHNYQRLQQLSAAEAAFTKSRRAAYYQVFIKPIADIRRDVWQHYSYVINLNRDTLSVGLTIAIATMLLWELGNGARRGLSRKRRKLKRAKA